MSFARPESPCPPIEARRRGRRARRLLVCGTVAVLLGVGYAIYNHANRRNVPVDYANDEEHFKYGSIGSDATGLPYWLWRAMPEVCPDLLPGGYEAIGLVREVGMDRPIGLSKRRTGLFDRVGPNCAFCHTATVRETREAKRTFYVGGPGHQVDLLRYFSFLFACAADERFTEDNVMAAIGRMTNLGVTEGLIYRRAVAPTREALQTQARRLAWIQKRPPWGPGRVDTFNPYKTLVFDLDMSHDDTIGTADFMPIWNQQVRDGLWLHWDGNNDSVDERNLSAATGAGATPENLDLARIQRVKRWIWTLPPRTYPFSTDWVRAFGAGKSIYQAECARCHDPHGPEVGQVVPLEYIGTDPERSKAFDSEMAKRMNAIGEGYPWEFRHFRPTNGYVNQPLDGVWLRAPYLHNGSVPTLRDLLRKPAERPRAFYKGDDVYDQRDVGFSSKEAGEHGRAFFLFDTTRDGNRNGGHLSGTDLADADKDALIEYLKTL